MGHILWIKLSASLCYRCLDTDVRTIFCTKVRSLKRGQNYRVLYFEQEEEEDFADNKKETTNSSLQASLTFSYSYPNWYTVRKTGDEVESTTGCEGIFIWHKKESLFLLEEKKMKCNDGKRRGGGKTLHLQENLVMQESITYIFLSCFVTHDLVIECESTFHRHVFGTKGNSFDRITKSAKQKTFHSKWIQRRNRKRVTRNTVFTVYIIHDEQHASVDEVRQTDRS